jgi:hypothetical protein
MVWKARAGNDPFRVDSTEAGVVFCSFFLLTFLALLIFLYLMNTCILGMIKLMMLSFQRPGPSSR